MEIKLTIPGKPFGKQRPKASRRGAFIGIRTPDKTVVYENLVRSLFVQKYPEHVLFAGPLQSIIECWFPVPPSWSNKKKQRAYAGEIFPETVPDADNIEKIIWDALQGYAYDDDKRIIHWSGSKQYVTSETDTPRVEVEIGEIE